MVEVLHHGNWLWQTWENLNVGDIVLVRDKLFFPADLLLLSSRFAPCFLQIGCTTSG